MYNNVKDMIGKSRDELIRIYGPVCSSEEVLDFMLAQTQPFWTKYEYNGKVYIMTFQYVVYEVLPRV